MTLGLFESVRKNHFAQMALCCMLPIVVIIILQLLGFTGWWVYALAVAACIGSHLALTVLGTKEGGKACH